MELLAQITTDQPNTIRVIDLDTGRQISYLRFERDAEIPERDDDEALMALHDADYLTVGSTWNRTATDGTACIEVQRLA